MHVLIIAMMCFGPGEFVSDENFFIFFFSVIGFTNLFRTTIDLKLGIDGFKCLIKIGK